MKLSYLERLVWCLELDMALARWVPAADRQVVWQILVPCRFPINCCHFGLKKKCMWMLFTPRKLGSCPAPSCSPHHHSHSRHCPLPLSLLLSLKYCDNTLTFYWDVWNLLLMPRCIWSTQSRQLYPVVIIIISSIGNTELDKYSLQFKGESLSLS